MCAHGKYMLCLVATHLPLRGRKAYAMIPPAKRKMGTFGGLIIPEWLYSRHRQSFSQIPTSACKNSTQVTATGIPLALRLYTSGLSTGPYYHVLLSAKESCGNHSRQGFLTRSSSRVCECSGHRGTMSCKISSHTFAAYHNALYNDRINCASGKW